MTDKEKSILLQARSLIFKYGIKSLTMDDISQRLGISKKTLYQFFENKADLVKKVMEFTIEENKENVCQAVDSEKNAIEELLQLYKKSTQMVKQLNPSLDFELRKYYPDSFSLLERFKNDFLYSSMMQNLAKGINDELYRSDLDIFVIAKVYTLAALEVFNSEIFPPDQFPPQKTLKELFIYHIRGIASKKGLEFLEKKLILEI